jgi:hypothetical protein
MTGVVVVLAVVAVAVVAYVVHNAEPILRKRVIASLENRFDSPVQLEALHISVLHGLQVSGTGLRIVRITSPGEDPRAANAPAMLTVDSFDFQTGVRQLLEPVMRVNLVRVHGLHLHIPPKGQRGPLLSNEPKSSRKKNSKLSIIVDEVDCSDVMLTIETDKPGKDPLVFQIRDVTLRGVGRSQPMPFTAQLVNPKPVGNIHSTGHFGPWRADEPRDTPIDGQYSFTNADLDPIKGIAGTLSSTGKYSGTLSQIGVVGTTDVPDFSLDVSQRPVHLRTDFDATVDGTTGDTVLNSVTATLLHTVLHVSGKVIRAADRHGKGHMPGDQPADPQDQRPGHFIDISVESDQARIEDILTLGAKTSPPLMHGAMTLRTHLTIPPESVTVSKKMRVQGRFTITGATFANPKWQETVDNLSMRAQGHPKESKLGNNPVVASQMSGNFALAYAMVNISDLKYKMPGAEVDLDGRYSLNGDTFDFAGKARTEATASAMLTGWKKWLAVPFDSLLKKDGAGVEVPITISGTKADPKFGVDFGKLKHQIFHHGGKTEPPQNPSPRP